MVDVVSKINTGAKYDSKAFKKSVGLSGVGAKAVNALSTEFVVQAFRDGQTKRAKFEYGKLTEDDAIIESSQRKGTKVSFRPDSEIFINYRYILEYVEKMLWNYAYLNPGLTLYLNGEKFYSENGLKDLLQDNLDGNTIHDIIHLKGDDIEVALTHSERMQGEQFYSFVNGQHTTQGGTHQNAFREALVATMRDFYGKNFDASDVRSCVIGAISLKVMEPVFESQTKTKLGSLEMAPGEIQVRTFVINFMKKELDNYLHRNALLQKPFSKRFSGQNASARIYKEFEN